MIHTPRLTLSTIDKRFAKITLEEGPERRGITMERLAHEFGVSPDRYTPKMSDSLVLKTTLKHQNTYTDMGFIRQIQIKQA